MNPNVDPCDDFSQFTCGAFYERTLVSDSDPMVNFQIVREIVDPSLGKAPQPVPGDSADESNLKKLQDMYASCMDVDVIRKAGRQRLVNQVQSVLSLLPDNDPTTPAGINKSALTNTMA
ncbi:hypothetical protein BGX29_002224 [Mortierella sp. GBA35]|nr:hypothetical protein BGX29_002224 [Mortierella sp. GBA35]